jgi:hypothetical protein
MGSRAITTCDSFTIGRAVRIASYLGKSDAFAGAIADFSVTYADQNERDYEAFTEAVKSGRLTAQTGV